MAAAAACGEPRPEGPPAVGMGPLPLGAAVERTLPEGECHAYTVELAAGEALRFEVEQRGVDVETAISGPGGRRIVFDSRTGAFGREPGVVVAERPGAYRTELCRSRRALGAESYRLTAERGPATPADRAAAEAARAYRRGRGRHRAEQLDEAIAAYRQARGRWRQAGERRGEAWALQVLGAAWIEQEEWALADQALLESLALYRELDEDYAAARTCLELITAQRRLGALAEAGACADLALEQGRRYGDPEVVRRAEKARAFVLYETGRAAEAVESYHGLLDRAREDGDMAEQIDLLSALGTAYLGAGEPDEALARFLEARELLASGELGGRKDADLLQNLARAHHDLGDAGDAVRAAEAALAIFERLAAERDVAETLDLLGRVCKERGDHRLARELFGEALAIFERLEEQAEVASVRINLGEHLNLTDWPEEAEGQCRLALAISRRIGRPALEASARYCIARSLYQLGRFAEAFDEAERCIGVAEDLRREKSHAGHRATYVARKRHYYELPVTIQLAWAEVDPDGGHAGLAYAAAERARTRTLLEALRLAGADPRAALDAGAARELARLDDEIARRDRELLLEPPDAAGRAAIEAALGSAIAERRLLEGRIRRDHPAYAELTEPARITLAEVQAELPADTQLLTYFVGEDASWAWLVDRSSSEVFRLAPGGELDELARKTHRLLAGSDNQKDRAAADRTAADLAGVVLGPLAGRLRGPRLAIAPDGALHYVPFGALPLPDSAAAGGRTVRLVDRFETVYPPSVAVVRALDRQRRGRERPAAGAVVLGDPVFDGTGLPRLEHSADEARTIAALIPGSRLRLGTDAGQPWVLGGGLAGASIVHFATHAVVDPRRPELSGIALSTVDAAGRPVDGMLRGHEIYGLDLDADLVVVSACSSGLGREVRGEGLLGVARGFLVAGASQVVVSLWDVDDEATAELMKRFHREMFEHGLPPAAALAEAQRAFAHGDRWSDPADWAAFVVQGDWRDGGSGAAAP